MDSILAGSPALKNVITRVETQKSGLLGRNIEDGQPLSPMAQLFHEPGSNLYIVAIMGFKTKLQPDIVKPILMHIFVKHPRFSSLQVRILYILTYQH